MNIFQIRTHERRLGTVALRCRCIDQPLLIMRGQVARIVVEVCAPLLLMCKRNECSRYASEQTRDLPSIQWAVRVDSRQGSEGGGIRSYVMLTAEVESL